MKSRDPLAIAIVLVMAACGDGGDGAGSEPSGAGPERGRSATAMASGAAELSPEELESGRLDRGWRQYASEDARERRQRRGGQAAAGSPDSGDTREGNAEEASGDGAGETGTSQRPSDQSWEDISPESVNQPIRSFPVGGEGGGPAIARIQVLLDAARFSPGAIDGRWGKNTEKALYWFQDQNGLEATGELDRETLQRLEQAAGIDRPVRSHTLTEADVAGPFVQLPEDVYERAEERCLCYESLREKLGEVFHASPELLERLNPDADLGSVAAGDRLHVPAVEPFHVEDLPEGEYTEGSRVSRIVISDGGHYLHALDDQGDILHHFPSTLGSDYAPSPSGEFSVRSITFDPTWHYQPQILTGVDPSRDDAVLPAGPNNAVGIVWMELSREHYGIHGTAAPETIGYVTSNGCVRLTNWDAATLGRMLPPGTEVEFRDVDGRE